MNKIYNAQLITLILSFSLLFSCNQNKETLPPTKVNNVEIKTVEKNELILPKETVSNKNTILPIKNNLNQATKNSKLKDIDAKKEVDEEAEEEERERKEMEEERLNESNRDSLEAFFLRKYPTYKEALAKNELEAAKERNQLRLQNNTSRNVGDGQLENFANNTIQGQWFERGSASHSGNIANVDYDPVEDAYYARSNTGSLWKKREIDTNWICLDNDRTYVQEIKALPNGRIITADYIPNTSNYGMVYIDNVNTSNCGFDTLIRSVSNAPLFNEHGSFGGAYLSDITYLTSGALRTTYALVLRRQAVGPGAKFNFDLYKSTNDGVDFTIIKTFNHDDSNAVVMHDPGYITDKTYIIDEDGTTDEKVLYELDINGITKIADITGIPNDIPKGTYERLSHMSIYKDPTTLKILYNFNKGAFYAASCKMFSYETTFPVPPNISFTTVTTTISNRMTNGFLSNTNKDIIYMGSYQVGSGNYGSPLLYKSTNSGANFNVIQNNGWACTADNMQHDDIRVIKSFKKTNGNSLIVWGCDGGLKTIENDGTDIRTISNPTSALFTSDPYNDNNRTRDLNVQEYYDVKTSPADTNLTWAGAQDFGFFMDNGFSKMKAFNNADCNSKNNVRNMPYVQSGEGGEIQFTMNGQFMWNQSYRGQLRVVSNPNPNYNNNICKATQTASLTVNYASIVNPVPFSWLMPSSPTPFSKTKNEIFVGGGRPVGSTLPQGSYLIKAKLVAGNIVTSLQGSAFNFAQDINNMNTYISAIGVTMADTNRIYVSNASSFFYSSKDYGATWVASSTTNLPGGNTPQGTGNSILVSQVDPDVVFVAGSSYGGSLNAIFKSVNGGINFTNISTGLPSNGVTISKICFNENETRIYAATTAGPYVYDIATNVWYNLKGLGAPQAIYKAVQLVKDNGTLRLGTYGRGIWDLKMANPNKVAPMEIVSIKTNQALTSVVNAGNENKIVLRVEITTKGNLIPLTLSQLQFNIGNTNLLTDIQNAKVFYTGTDVEFGTTTSFGNIINNPVSNNLIFNNNITLKAGVNFLYLVYDVSCTATQNNILDAALINATIAGNTITSSNGDNPTGSRLITNNPSSNLVQIGSSNTTVSAGAVTTPILKIAIQTTALCANTVSELVFNNSSSTNAITDIGSAVCYYTSSATFNTNTPFGTVSITPNGNFNFSGSQLLAANTTSYFWLVYNINCDATDANTIAANAVSITSNTAINTLTNAIFSKTINGFNTPTFATGLISIEPSTYNNKLLSIKLPATNCYNNINSVTFNLAKNTTAAIYENAQCYYTTTPTLPNILNPLNKFGSTIPNPNGNITFTGSLPTNINNDYYFWLLLDVNCLASITHNIESKIVAINTNNGNINSLPIAAIATANIYFFNITNLNIGMANGNLSSGSINQKMLNVFHNRDYNCGTNVDNIVFNTSTSTNPAVDIKNAKCYITSSTTFNTNTPYGNVVLNPNGDIEFIGTYTHPAYATRYYWLTYDIDCNATIGNTISASFIGMNVNNTTFTVNATPPLINHTIITTPFTSISNGSWNNASTWECGRIPVGPNDIVTINHLVEIDNTGNICGNVTVSTTGHLTLTTSGELTLGVNSASNNSGNSNKICLVNGRLEILDGILNINGGLILTTNSNFILSGGTINLDPNDGYLATSYPSTTLAISTANQTVTGGTINIIDPPFNLLSPSIINSTNANRSWSTACTVNIGGGDDINPGHPGFKISSATSGAKYTLEIGTLNILTGCNLANNRNLNLANLFRGLIVKNLTVQAGADITSDGTTGELFVTGNLNNNGNIAAIKRITFCGNYLYSGSGNTYNTIAKSNLQSINGTGYFLENTSSVYTNQNQNTVNEMAVYHVSNSAGLTLNMPLSIKNRILFGGGKINTTATNLLSLGTALDFCAVADGTGLSISNFIAPTLGWVNGPLKYNSLLGTAPLQFLIGNSIKAFPMQILPQTGFSFNNGLIAEYNTLNGGINGLPATDFAYNATSIYPNGYWSANTSSISGTYDIQVSGTDFTNLATNNANTDVRLIKRPNNTSNWNFEGSHSNTTGTILRRNDLNSFSDFAITINSNVTLAINKINFTGILSANNGIFNWKIDATSNNYTSIIQKSTDGVNYTDLTTFVKTANNKYTFTDFNIEIGNWYYRIKVNENNAVYYSNPVLLQPTIGLGVNIYPNPAEEKIIITGFTGNATIQILNNIGAIVKQIKTNTIATAIDINNLPSGTYMLIYNNNKRQFKKQFIKK